MIGDKTEDDIDNLETTDLDVVDKTFNNVNEIIYENLQITENDDESSTISDLMMNESMVKINEPTTCLTISPSQEESVDIDATKSVKSRMFLSTDDTSCLLFTQTVTSPMLTPSEENIDFLKGFKCQSPSNQNTLSDNTSQKSEEDDELVSDEIKEFDCKLNGNDYVDENIENIYENVDDDDYDVSQKLNDDRTSKTEEVVDETPPPLIVDETYVTTITTTDYIVQKTIQNGNDNSDNHLEEERDEDVITNEDDEEIVNDKTDILETTNDRIKLSNVEIIKSQFLNESNETTTPTKSVSHQITNEYRNYDIAKQINKFENISPNSEDNNTTTNNCAQLVSFYFIYFFKYSN